ncbi:unnamed protein product [Brachionus calyciflorus]|uniref:Uncharacterized protein n=1 Tax=Brachionus calyciflorus TaxID=104777 RepID=A0A814FVH9_9BILA|nr:unnamed protein product [Brachionus calyciflorus]
MKIELSKKSLFDLLQKNRFKINQVLINDVIRLIEQLNNDYSEFIRFFPKRKELNSKFLILKKSWKKLKGGRAREIFKQNIAGENSIVEIYLEKRVVNDDIYLEDSFFSKSFIADTTEIQKINNSSKYNEILNKVPWVSNQIDYQNGSLLHFQSKLDFILFEILGIKIWSNFLNIYHENSINIKIMIKKKKVFKSFFLIISFSIISKKLENNSYIFGLFNITNLTDNQILECLKKVIEIFSSKKIMSMPDKEIIINYFIESDYKVLSILSNVKIDNCLFCKCLFKQGSNSNAKDLFFKEKNAFSICPNIINMFMRITDSIFENFLNEIYKSTSSNATFDQKANSLFQNFKIIEQFINNMNKNSSKKFQIIIKKKTFCHRDLRYFEKITLIEKFEEIIKSEFDYESNRFYKIKTLFEKFANFYFKIVNEEIIFENDIFEWHNLFIEVFKQENTTAYIHFFVYHFPKFYADNLNKGGRKHLSAFFRESIENHMKSISSLAAKRFLKKCQSNAFYSSVSFLEGYSSFPLKNQISFSSFYKYLGEKYKKPHRISDLCDYCEANKLYKREVLGYAIKNGYDQAEERDFNLIAQYLSTLEENDEIQEIKTLINNINDLDFHKVIATRQRSAYNFMKSNLEDDYILIEIDWKQKILIGMSPRQTSSEYREQKSRTCLGFGIYYKKNNETKLMNIDLISSFQENESALDVIRGFRFLRELEEFKTVETNKYLVWTDTGTHFRWAELIYYLFKELADEKIQVCLNFFCEKHGKNGRDQHFSLVSNFIKQESLVKKLTCSKDIVDAIHKHQTLANEHREKLKLKPNFTKAYVIEKEVAQNSQRQFRKINNIRLYYNFFNDKEFNLKSTILSDLRVSKEIQFKDKIQYSELSSTNNSELKIENNINLDYFSKKMYKLRELLNDSNFKIDEKEIDVESIENGRSFSICTQECLNCKITTKFTTEQLEKNSKNLLHKEIQLELESHQHPKFKKNSITGKNRSKKEAVEELIKHYRNNHVFS